jgi:hypothetical protein
VAPAIGFMTSHMHSKLENQQHAATVVTLDSDTDSLPLSIIMVLFMQPKLMVVNTNPKLRIQNGVGTEFSCLKCRKNLTKKL